MAGSLILVANPGSASRKYALFDGRQERASLHFEWHGNRVVCTLQKAQGHQELPLHLTSLNDAVAHVITLLHDNNVLYDDEKIERIGLRIVAPSAYFLEDRIVDGACIAQLETAQSRAPLHINATLDELKRLRNQFGDATIIGISDSAFHRTKPDYAWNYGITLEDADRFDIKRFGYHGLSVSSIVHQLQMHEKLPAKLVVCHLGSGASVTAILHGKSIDNTMGYSPLEGVIMGTRSGSIDPVAVKALKDARQLDDAEIEDYLHNHSGLLGLGGSSDIRELLQREASGEHRAELALNTYVYNIQKAIGQMVAALHGADVLVFTGTVGERSDVIRQRIANHLHYLDFELDEHTNRDCNSPEEPTVISRLAHSKPIFVVSTNEAAEMARCCFL